MERTIETYEDDYDESLLPSYLFQKEWLFSSLSSSVPPELFFSLFFPLGLLLLAMNGETA